MGKKFGDNSEARSLEGLNPKPLDFARVDLFNSRQNFKRAIFNDMTQKPFGAVRHTTSLVIVWPAPG